VAAVSSPKPFLVSRRRPTAIFAALALAATACAGSTNDDATSLTTGPDDTITIDDPPDEGGDTTAALEVEDADDVEDAVEVEDSLLAPVTSPTASGASVSGPPETVAVTDDSSRITVSIPAEWTDISTEPGDAGSQIVASIEAVRFFEAVDLPGVSVQVADVEPGMSDELSSAAARSIASSLGDRGCTERSVEPVDEREFLGGEIVLDCFAGLDTRVLGLATTSAATDAVVVIILVTPSDDVSIRQLVLSTLVAG